MNKLSFILPLSLILLSINFTFPIGLGFYDFHRSLQLLSIMFILVVFSFSLSHLSVIRGLGFDRLWCNFCACYSAACLILILSVYSASYPLDALKGVIHEVLLILSALVLSIYALNNRDFVTLAIAYTGLVGLGLYYFQFFVGFFSGIFSGTSIEREVLVHHFSNIRFLNHLQVLFFPFIFFLSIQSRQRLIRLLALIISVLTISILLFLSARAALGCLLIAAFIIFTFSKHYRVYVTRFFLVLFIGLVVYFLCLKGLPLWWNGDVAPIKVNLNSSGRWDMWLESFDLLKDNWLFGVGSLHYSLVSTHGFGHPHNLIIQIGLEYGVIILLLFAFVITKLCLAIYKKLSNSDSNTIISCFPFIWSVLAIAGVSMFSGVWVIPLTQLLFILCVAPLMSLLFEKGKPSNLSAHSNQPKSVVLFIRLLFFSGIIGLCVLVYPDLKLRLQDHANVVPVKGTPVYAPRFWQDDIWPEK